MAWLLDRDLPAVRFARAYCDTQTLMDTGLQFLVREATVLRMLKLIASSYGQVSLISLVIVDQRRLRGATDQDRLVTARNNLNIQG
jgi:hypothetical protein